MAEREHFTNGRCLTFGTGFAIMGTSFGAQVGGWQHWITIGAGYGVGIILMLIATVLITKSYFSRHPESHDGARPLPALPSVPKSQAVEDLFSSLQIEAFQLAKNLRSFLKEIGPHPEITKANGELDHRAAVKYTEWSAKLINGYRGRFASKVELIMTNFGDLGVTSCYELNRWTQGITLEVEVRLCAQTLERISLELGSIDELRFSRCEVEAMSPVELSQTAEAYPGFTELANYYSKT
jgi:hypothetical protein